METSTNGHASGQPDHGGHHENFDDYNVAPGWKKTLPRALGVAAFLAMAVFWMYAFANTDSVPHQDEFDDPAFATTAEGVCAKRQAAIAELPLATGATDPQARGVLVVLGTEQLELMVSELAELTPPTDPKGADGVIQWLDDYQIYLNDRLRYSDALARGEDPPFTLSPNAKGARVTDALRTFAEVNMMDSCAPSGDA